MEHVIITKSLKKHFGIIKAVDGLDLKVRKGEIYGLLGPNGSGKTTTVKMLCALLTPTEGEVEVLGETVPSASILPKIGYMPQETAIIKGITVHDNIVFFGEVYGLSPEEINKREAEVLEFVDLTHRKDSLVEELSGGMRHRVSLACAMVHSPELLLLDEPTVGVDPLLRSNFWELFNRLTAEGTSILMTTHYMDEAKNCHRVGLMRKGKLIAEGLTGDITKAVGTDDLEEAFLRYASVQEPAANDNGGEE